MQMNADQTEEGTHEGTYPLPSLPRRRRLQTMQHTLHHGIVRAKLRSPMSCRKTGVSCSGNNKQVRAGVCYSGCSMRKHNGQHGHSTIKHALQRLEPSPEANVAESDGCAILFLIEIFHSGHDQTKTRPRPRPSS